MKRILRALLLPAVSAALAAEAAAPRFSGSEDLDGLGISVPALAGARQLPVKPVEVVRYQWRRGNETWTEERSSMDELWTGAQTAATWEDKSGNRMVLGRVLAKPSPALAGTDVAHDTFERHMADPDQALGPDASPDELAAWAEAFSGAAAAGDPVRVPVNRARLADLFLVPSADPLLRVFLFRFDLRHAGQAKAPPGWFAVVFRLAAAPEGNAFDRQLRDGFLPGIRTTGALEGTRAERVKRRPRPSGDDAGILQDAARARARESVALLDDWWTMDSPRYVLLSDDPDATRRADEILGRLEAARPLYEAHVPAFPQTIEQTSVVRLFRRRADYVDYVRDGGILLNPEDSAGIFDGGRRELVIRPREKNAVMDVDSVIRHEGFHQYVFGAWNGIDPSPWFNEGTAVFFETLQPQGGGRWKMQEHPFYAPRLERLAKSRDSDWPALVRWLLCADYESFYRRAPGGDASNAYGLAYGLMYFLFRGAPSVRGDPYEGVLSGYAAELLRTGDPLRATLTAFRMGERGADTAFADRLAADLQAFWKNDSARRSARSAPIPGAAR